MSTQYQLRRGTTAECLLFTGAQGEVVVDTDKNTLVVQDGVTAGGYPQATQVQVSNGTFYYNEDVSSAADAYILIPKTTTNVPTAYFDGVQFGFVSVHPNTGPSTANFQGLGVKSLKYPGGVDPLAGDINGRVYLIYDAANGWLEIQRKAIGPPPQIRTVGASVSGNAVTASLSPCTIDFRSSSLGNGTPTTRNVTSTISVTAPSGATLGTQSGVSSRIVILAINGPSGAELAITNLAGGLNLDETTLINTVAISGSATSASVVYSTTARTGVPFRVVGFFDSTQPSAGVWTTTPSQVQGQGGQTIVGASTTKITSGSSQSTIGTSTDFTSIPAGVKRITISLSGVSTNSSSFYLLQIGAGSVDTAGYSGVSASGTALGANSTAGWLIGVNQTAAGLYSGLVTLVNISGNTWVESGCVGAPTLVGSISSGTKTLSGVLDRIRLTTVIGTDTFDAGSMNILYEV
ncbi:hypothetical protein SAMN03159476_00403 [Pseudomonas sp. NFPP05]|uniref:hyaluronate lyase N-terminal domain-containing protein n=1 Tax=unclassified Pseudomonas TaxID=196821 RepID=UPI000883AE91|nr:MULTISPECIES: hypothetical protein [unclassified Pseudomonas]SDA11221.1 hypothetical protein SAMN03159465_00403 [Pseudomonas sp. NFPP12]SFM12406.1 hypothetical protein SAMN03159476_00403 [Pseudomonas sp. NFPP05]